MFKKINFITLLCSFLLNTTFSQTPTLTISNVKVNGQPITNNTINFGNLDQVTVSYRVDFVKPDYLTLGSVRYVNGVYNNNGFVQLFTPQSLNLTTGNTGFTDLREYVLYANNYSTCNSTHRLSAEVLVVSSNISYASNTISIKRNPQFSLSTNVDSINCGSSTPVIFTANTQDCLQGAQSYVWNIGNGWLLPNGTNSPSTITTTSNSITLIPTQFPPSSVSVTPVIGSIQSSSRSKTIGINSAFTNFNGSLTSVNTFCSGSTYVTLGGVPSSANVTWNVSTSGAVTVSNQTNGGLALTRIGTNKGLVTVSALISSCGESRTVTKTIYVGEPQFKEVIVTNSDNFLSISPSPSNDCGVIALQVNTFQPQSQILEIQWEKLTPNVMWSRDYSAPTNSNTVALYPEFNIIFEFRVRFRSACGWSDWQELSYYITTCSTDYQPPFNGIVGDNFLLSPVPVTNNSLVISINQQAPWFLNTGGNNGTGVSLDPGTGGSSVPSQVTVAVQIFNQSGIQVLNFPNRIIPTTLDLSSLNAGTYVIVFSYQGLTESHTFIKN